MSKKNTNGPLKQLFELAPGIRERSTQFNYGRFIDEGGSVFDIVKMGRQAVVQKFGLHSLDAQKLLDRAMSLAVYTARQFREECLVRPGPLNPLHRTGVSAEIKTPDFEDLFDPDWERSSPSSSPDARISPAAYFLRLVLLARDLEERAKHNPGLITFETRRPDLTRFIIDTASMYQIKPTVSLVNEVLHSIIETHLKTLLPPPKLDEPEPVIVVDDKMLETRYPQRSMPFERYWEEIKLVLEKNELSLGEVVRAIDVSAPYYKQPGARGDLSDIALHQSCLIGPRGQQLLIESFLPDASTPAEKEKFYKDNFGSTLADLQDSVHFCAQTSIDAKTLTSLLSIEDFAPLRSPNVNNYLVPAASPKVFGSSYINEGDAEAMGLTPPVAGETRTFVNDTLNRFERMNRMLRLSRWLGEELDDCDLLVAAAHKAEIRGEIKDPDARRRELASRSMRITTNTLRALGQFREFRLQFKCSARQYAALIDEISPYARGKELSQFDELFNKVNKFDTPLKADNGYFAIEPQTRSDQRTVDQICASLGLNRETWRHLARFVAKSYNLQDELQRNLPIFTSFYRLVLLASFLRVTPIELAALLEVLSDRGGTELLQRVLGEAKLLVSGTRGIGDVLSVMHAAQACVGWVQENGLTVTWLVQRLVPVIAPPMAAKADITLLQEVHNRLQPVRLTEASFQAAGVPPSNDTNGQGWLSLLEQLVDRNGLVSSFVNEQSDHERAVAEIQAAVIVANLPPADVYRVRTAILALVMQAWDAQCAVVQESLSVYLSLTQDLVLPLLKWVDSRSVYLLLKETTRALDAVTSGADEVKVGDEVLNLLARLFQRAEVVRSLALSSAVLVALTTRQNWQWFGLKHAGELTLNTLYQLTLFQRAVKHSGQPAEKILDYMDLVFNGLPAVLTPEDLWLIRDSAATRLAVVLKWGVREVLECIIYLVPSKPIVRDITTLDTLLRIRGLANYSGLDAKAIIRLGALTPASDKQAWRGAAEHVLEALSKPVLDAQAQEVGEIGQSVTHEIRCVNDTLIANVPGEVALIELSLRDLANQVLRNITVTWSADRPGLLDQTSITDHEGRAVIRFKPEEGPWMGLVQVVGSYGLAQKVYAPKIIVDCDELTLGFTLSSTKPPPPDKTFLAGGVDFYPVSVGLADTHGNPGIGRTVTFSGQGVVADPLVAVTDEKGIATTRVRSVEPVDKASLVVSYSTKDSYIVSNLTFVDNPSFKRLEVVSMAVVGQPLVLRCEVVGLGRLPSPGVEVELYSDLGADPIDTQTTSELGIAEFTLTSPAAGKHTFTAKVAMDQQAIEVQVATTAVIHGESVEFQYPVAGVGSSTLLWVNVREAAHNQAMQIPNCPVWWSGTGPEPMAEVSYPTDAAGRSTFLFEAKTVGDDYVITAVCKVPPTSTRSFNLKVVPALNWTFTLTDITTRDVVNHASANEPLAFIRGRTYRLVIALPDSVDLSGARAMLAWDSEFSAPGLGMGFTPLTGAYVVIGTEKELSWNIVCGDLRNGSFKLTFYCDRLVQRLEIPGRLNAPPPVVLSPIKDATVEVQPMLHGRGSPSAQIYVFEGQKGTQLATTSVGNDGTWAVRVAEYLSPGPHVFSIKERHIDTSEAWATDVNVTVSVDFVEKVNIISPVSGSTVPLGTWIEGTGMPGVEVRFIQVDVVTNIYASGMVNADGRWRVQFKPNLLAGTYSCGTAFYIDDVKKSDWLPKAYVLTFI